jgi:hypothetical protein
MVNFAEWSANRLIRKTLLESLGDPGAQRRILGDEYHWMYACIVGEEAVEL